MHAIIPGIKSPKMSECYDISQGFVIKYLKFQLKPVYCMNYRVINISLRGTSFQTQPHFIFC